MFIAIPTGMNYRTERLPVVTFTLIGLNSVIWLISAICFLMTDGESLRWEAYHLWLVPADCTWYAPLTSMFEHSGPFHLIGNMLFLFLFGSCVEDMIGRARFLIFYLLGGFIAEVVYIGMSPDHFQSVIPMCGASGAISACLGMYLMLRAGADIEIKYFFWLYVYIRAGEFEIPAWVAICFWFGEQLLSAALQLLLGSGGHGGVAFGAHVGGFLGGLGLLWLNKKFLPKHEEEEEVEPVPSGPIIDTRAMVAATRGLTPAVALSVASSETPSIYLHDGSQQTGPFTLTAVQLMLNNGEISRECHYWSEGMSNWERVVDLADRPME